LVETTGLQWKPRAKRFSIQTRIQYRLNGETDWSTGITDNISRSGVLFEAKREIELAQMIEMRILFPAKITGSVPTNLFCRGLVVRTEPARASQWGCGIVSSIIKHHIVSE
jgi:hypothetical protein